MSSEHDTLSAREDVRRVCLGVLAGAPPSGRFLLVSVGEGFTTAVFALGAEAIVFWNVSHAALVATAVEAEASNTSGRDAVSLLRAVALESMQRSRLGLLGGDRCQIVGASRIARAVITLAAEGGSAATPDQVRNATDTLAETWAEGRLLGFPRARVRAMLVGAAVLEAVVGVLGGEPISATAEALPRLLLPRAAGPRSPRSTSSRP
jgi:hypothetical protein